MKKTRSSVPPCSIVQSDSFFVGPDIFPSLLVPILPGGTGALPALPHNIEQEKEGSSNGASKKSNYSGQKGGAFLILARNVVYSRIITGWPRHRSYINVIAHFWWKGHEGFKFLCFVPEAVTSLFKVLVDFSMFYCSWLWRSLHFRTLPWVCPTPAMPCALASGLPFVAILHRVF